VAFASNRGSDNRQNLYQKSSSGVGTDELLFAGESNELPFPEDWSPDGRHLIFARVKLGQVVSSDLWALPLFGDKKPFPLLQSSFWQVESQLSPDGRWFAFTTNESGTHQIVVQPFPDPNGGKWQITANGGIEPKWRRDGRELYYLGLDGRMMGVPVKSGTTFEFGQPSPLFQALANVPPPLPVVHHYDVTADGQRFLVMTPVTPSSGDATAAPITAVVNWTAGLGKK
jgi:WD40-like Beta Propeller Repeat